MTAILSDLINLLNETVICRPSWNVRNFVNENLPNGVIYTLCVLVVYH
jgi:hypothetical protein